MSDVRHDKVKVKKSENLRDKNLKLNFFQRRKNKINEINENYRVWNINLY